MPSRSEAKARAYTNVCLSIIAASQAIMAILSIVAAAKLADYEARASAAAKQSAAHLRQAQEAVRKSR